MYGDGRRLDFGWWVHNAIYIRCVVELYTWNLDTVINQRHPNKLSWKNEIIKKCLKLSFKWGMTETAHKQPLCKRWASVTVLLMTTPVHMSEWRGESFPAPGLPNVTAARTRPGTHISSLKELIQVVAFGEKGSKVSAGWKRQQVLPGTLFCVSPWRRTNS